jgi:hypothetical protein
LCYAEHENGDANAAYVPVLTGECQVIAGFRCQRKQVRKTSSAPACRLKRNQLQLGPHVNMDSGHDRDTKQE